MPKGKSAEQLTKNKKPKAIKSFGMTLKLPATPKKKKKSPGPVGGPKPKKKKKGIADLFSKKKPGQGIPQTPFPAFKKKKKQKLTEEQIKNVEKDATVMEIEDIPGTPHFRMVPKKSGSGTKIMEVKKGGLMEATKRLKAQGLKKGGFPDLSGDGKVTMKDILMGRGVVKKPKKKAMGGSMTLEKGKLKGVKDAPEERAREAGFILNKKRRGRGFQSKANYLGKGAAAGVAGAMKAGAKAMKKAGRLAIRGYGKARK